MLEVTGNMFKMMQDYEAICVTTNGVLKSNGELVMGAGIALQFKRQFNGIEFELGKLVVERGNVPNVVKRRINYGRDYIHTKYVQIISYPTKHHYREDSDLNLIYHGALAIAGIADELKLSRILLTRPGCGLGNRSWEYEVKPLLTNIFDDRFTVLG